MPDIKQPSKSNKKTKKNKKKKKFRIFKIVLLVILSTILVCGIASAGVIMAMIKTTPDLDVNEILKLNEPSVLYDDKGNFMDYVISSENRKVVTIKNVPEDLKYAFVAIEDERFFKHNGIDVKRIGGAVYYDILSKLNKKSDIQGASTITQQLIKNRLFLANSLAQRLSIKRKVQEIYLALQLEKVLSKDQILETYMNTIYLGGQCYGIGAASEHYFSKDPKDLSTIECAFIAGLAQSPSGYYPFSPNNEKDSSKYLNRTKTVLSQMLKNKFISKEEYDNCIKELGAKGISFKKSIKNHSTYKYEYFSMPAIDQVKEDLKEQYNYTDDQVNDLVSSGGLKIYTTMDANLQNKAQEILNTDSSFTRLKSSKSKSGLVTPQAAAVVIDNASGEVKTIIGGRGTQPANSYNRATSDNFKKQTGSSIKPLTVYGPAIDTGKLTAASIIEDSPLSNELMNKYGYSSQPHNDDSRYEGKMTLSRALTRSRNIAAIKIEDMISLSTGYNYASKFNLNLDPKDKVMSALSLGQQAYGTTPLRMASAFSVFGNHGLQNTPKFYTKVIDKRGITILTNKTTSQKVISPQSAYIMFNLLKGPIYNSGGTAPSAKIGSMPVAGKTGTSTNHLNLWFCGLSPYYSTAVWLGTDDNHKFYGTNGRPNSNSVANAWSLIMKEANKGKTVKDIDKPNGIVEESICSESGKIATPACKAAGKAHSVFFIEGTEPTALCDSHNQTIDVPKETDEKPKDENTAEDKNEEKKDDDKKPTTTEDNANKDKTPSDENKKTDTTQKTTDKSQDANKDTTNNKDDKASSSTNAKKDTTTNKTK